MMGADLDADTYNGQLGERTVDFAYFYADEPTGAIAMLISPLAAVSAFIALY